MVADAIAPSGRIFALGTSSPRIGRAVWIAPGAIVIGDVTIGDGSSVWFNCVLRGDTNSISIGSRSNIQDGTIIHVDPGPMSTTIEDDVTIGHGSIIHGCRLMDRAFIGMGAVILNGATIESDGMLAAGAVLTSGKRIQTGELWAGSPAKLFRKLRDDELVEIRRNADHYTRNGQMFRSNLFACAQSLLPALRQDPA
jgi:carbonic anhydrase/acetyltransferase-like protein (isoleucine patch superfamily)